MYNRGLYLLKKMLLITLIEPRHEKNHNMGFDQVQHKSACTVTEAGYKLEILDLRRREIVLSV